MMTDIEKIDISPLSRIVALLAFGRCYSPSLQA